MAHARALLNLTSLPQAGGLAYPFINHFKNCTQNGQAAAYTLDGSLVDANGYLTAAPASAWGGGLQLPAYSGSWVCKWTGTAEVQLSMNGTLGFTVSSGLGFVTSSLAGAMVDIAGTNARVVFKPSSPESTWIFHLPTTGTYSGWGNLVLCRDVDEAALDAGKLFNPDFVAALKKLNPGILRFMQWNDIIFGTDSQPFTYGNNINSFTYTGSQYPSAMWGGTISSSLVAGVRTYTCSKPSGLSGSITAGEMILGNISTSPVETATVTISNASPAVVTWTGSNCGVDTAVTFSTTGALPTGITAFNGGSASVYYVISAGLGANSFQISLTKGGAAINTSSAGSGTHTITAYRPAVLNVGARGAKPVSYYGDINNSDISARQLTVNIQVNQVHTFTYDQTTDTYLYTNPTVGVQGISSCPVSVEVALSNEIGSDFYYCFPQSIIDSEVTAIVGYIRDNLSSNLNFYNEAFNEVWNPGTGNQALCRTWAAALGGGLTGGDAYVKRHCEIMALVKAAWAPRNPNQLKRILGLATGFYGNPPGFKGPLLEGSNLSAYGFNASPNRPIDRSEGFNHDTYFEGPSIPVGDTGYTATGQEGLYTAADNFALGTPTGISLGLNFVDNDLRQGTGGNGFDVSNLSWLSGRYSVFEALAASYDTSRGILGQAPLFVVAYEGGMQGAVFPSVAYLNAIGLNGALYGGPTGRIALLFDAYKHSALFKQLCLDFYFNFLGAGGSINQSLPHYLANGWYDFCGDGSKWAMYPGDLLTTPFTSFDAMQQFDLVGTRNLLGDF